MKITAIKCKKCGNIIYSRTRHDFHWCSCHSCAIDGGFDYMNITGNKEDWESVFVDVDTTELELYQDWNNGTNKYGIIK